MVTEGVYMKKIENLYSYTKQVKKELYINLQGGMVEDIAPSRENVEIRNGKTVTKI